MTAAGHLSTATCITEGAAIVTPVGDSYFTQHRKPGKIEVICYPFQVYRIPFVYPLQVLKKVMISPSLFESSPFRLEIFPPAFKNSRIRKAESFSLYTRFGGRIKT